MLAGDVGKGGVKGRRFEEEGGVVVWTDCGGFERKLLRVCEGLERVFGVSGSGVFGVGSGGERSNSGEGGERGRKRDVAIASGFEVGFEG